MLRGKQYLKSSVILWKLINPSRIIDVPSCSVPQSYPTVCIPRDCNTPGFPVLHHFPELAQTHVHWVSDAIQLSVLCRPLLLLPSIFRSIRVFSNESTLPIRWSKYWSLSSSIYPSNEYSGLISFRMDWFNLLVVQGSLKSLLQHQKETIDLLNCPLAKYQIPHLTFSH